MSNTEITSQITKAIGAHGTYKFKLHLAIDRGTSDLAPEAVKCDDKCEFGKWLYGPTLSENVRAGMPYQVVRRLHAEFHKCAGRVLEHAVSHNAMEANRLMNGEFDERSQILVVALNKWKRELQMQQAA